MKIWLVEMWVALDGERVPAGSAACASYDLAVQFVKQCAKDDGVPVWQANHAGYTRYITPETELMRAMEYVIRPMDVIENLS